MRVTRLLCSAATTAAIAFASAASNAAIVIDGSTLGYYNAGLGDLSQSSNIAWFPAPIPGPDPTVAFATQPPVSGVSNLGTWLGAAAPSGGTWSAAPQAIPATWTITTETAIVYVIDAGDGLANARVDIGVDNGIYAWLDGAYLFGAMAPGGVTLGEHGLDLGPLSAGLHFLQLLLEDHGGLTGYEVRMTADRAVAVAVPEPAAAALLGIGLFAAGWARRRQS